MLQFNFYRNQVMKLYSATKKIPINVNGQLAVDPQSKIKSFLSHLSSSNLLQNNMKGDIIETHSQYLGLQSERQEQLDESYTREEVLMKGLQKLKKKVDQFQEENENLKEEIEFRMINFQYIIELASSMIFEKIQKKVEETLKIKNQIIKKMTKQKLKQKEQHQRRQKVLRIQSQKTNQKYKKLVLQNVELIKKNQKLERILGERSEQKIFNQKFENNQLEVQVCQSYHIYRDKNNHGKQIQIKKKKTIDSNLQNMEKSLETMEDSHKFQDSVSSIRQLKLKIHKLKSEICFDVSNK